MNTVSVSATQVMGIAIGLLVVIAGVIVNLQKFGSDIPLPNLMLYIALGIIIILTMYILARD